VTWVKICGNRRAEEARLAAFAGADAVGAVVASPRSARNLSIEEAERALAGALPPEGAVGPRPLRVAVTVATDAETLRALAAFADAVQCPASVDARTIASLRDSRGDLLVLLSTRPDGWQRAAAHGDAVLLDKLAADGYGGTGSRVPPADAEAIARSCPRPLVLAGGLTPENVGGAVAAVRPFGVDVASGVETGGIKDPSKVRAFVRAAKSAVNPDPVPRSLVARRGDAPAGRPATERRARGRERREPGGRACAPSSCAPPPSARKHGRRGAP
jgi:phosphoribosylanthranilate isomerase